METTPTPTSRTPTQTKPDGLISALGVVCPLICGRALTPEEIRYIRTRVSRHEPATLLEALEWLGDHADRVGNPIAAILDRCGVIRKDRDQRAEAARLVGDIAAAKARKAAKA